MKRRIRLTENDLHRIVKESVKKILKEDDYISLDGAEYPTLESPTIKKMFDDLKKGKISPEEAEKIYQTELSWQGLRKNGNGITNQSDAEWNRDMYNKGQQHRIHQRCHGVDNPFGLPNENPNLF